MLFPLLKGTREEFNENDGMLLFKLILDMKLELKMKSTFGQFQKFIISSVSLNDYLTSFSFADALSPWDLSKSPAQFLHFAGAGPKFQKSK